MESEAIAALFGAFVGAAGPIAVNLINDRVQRKRRAKQISLAVAGEVAAILEIIRRRNYLEGIRKAESDAETGNPWFIKIRITREYFPVVEAALVDLGILPDELPSLIPRFLTLAKSALEDLQALDGGHWNDRAAEDIIDGYRGLRDVFEGAMEVAAAILVIVRRLYPPSEMSAKQALSSPL